MDLIDDDDDSEDDPDYNPDEDKPVDDSGDEGNGEKKLVGLSKVSRRKVDEIWRQMQEEDRKHIEEIMRKSPNYEAYLKTKTEEGFRKGEQIIAQIFGKRVARKIVHAVSIIPPKEELTTEEIQRRALASAQNVRKKRKISETRKFAGQEITVEKTVMASAEEEHRHKKSRSTADQGGIDGVLSTIKGPKLISTVVKSSMDWDVYKEKEGLEEDLQVAAKEGYLTRKDFLERCDVRTYEKDKAERVSKAQH